MADPFLGQISIQAFEFAPKGWALCNGQLLPINQNQALFSLLGTTYGGDGRTTFALPNLQGRVPVHRGSSFTQGQAGGEAAHTLVTAEMPAHNHTPQGTAATINAGSPVSNTWGQAATPAYSNVTTGLTAMVAGTIGQGGSNQPHNNQPPYLVLNFVIALVGIFPSRN